MKFSVEVRTAIRNDYHPVIGIAGMKQGRKNDTARGNTGKHQVFDLMTTQDHFQVAAGKSADPAFRHHHFSGLRRDGRVNLNGLLDAGEACALQRTKRLVGGGRTDLGNPFTESYHNIDDGYLRGPRGRDRVSERLKKRLAVRYPADGTGLNVHDEQSRG